MLDMRARQNGTKFLVYPQDKSVPGFENPEVVYIAKPAGTVQAGPEDDRMYVVDVPGKIPFGNPGSPPFQYRFNPPSRNPAVQPDAQGHFDHLRPGDSAFSAATMYATVRRVLDIWEDYFGRTVPWPWPTNVPKLLLIPMAEFNNAWSSTQGFLEFGYPTGDRSHPYCENFDVLAHELGHSLKFSVIGLPKPGHDTEEYGGHHEAFGDLVAIVASLHFDSVLDHLLSHTKGNLFSVNELSRVGELSQGRAIRIAFNDKKMSTVGREPHDLSEPFTGGAFDILVEIFQRNLIERGLITQQLGDLSYHVDNGEVSGVQEQFALAYNGKEAAFKEALLDARDKFGKLMATAWSRTSADDLHYGKVLENILEADRQLYNGSYQQTIRGCFDWREITAATALQPLQFQVHVVDELVTV